MKLSGSLPMAAILFLLALAAFRSLDATLGFHAGLLSGYILYEFLHLGAHAHWRVPGLRYMHRQHLMHHFGDSQRTFGVTSPLWDWVFGTLPPKRDHTAHRLRKTAATRRPESQR